MAKVFNDEKMTEILISYVHVSKEALNLALKLNGDKEQTYKDILFVYAGISDFEYFVEEVLNE